MKNLTSEGLFSLSKKAPVTAAPPREAYSERSSSGGPWNFYQRKKASPISQGDAGKSPEKGFEPLSSGVEKRSSIALRVLSSGDPPGGAGPIVRVFL